METFSEPREFVQNPQYSGDRRRTLAALDMSSIDEPIVDIVASFAALPHCFPLHCCYGHFVCAPDQDSRTLDPVPPDHPGLVRYRIAYVAFCLENSHRAWVLRKSLARIPAVDPRYVQFGTPDWFWIRLRLVNSYALQVEPIAHRLEDEAMLGPAEALRTQKARDIFFTELRAVLAPQLTEHAPG